MRKQSRLKQGIGACPDVNGASQFSLNPVNFYLKRGLTGLQLFHRQRIEILPQELRQRIIRLFRQKIVQIHVPKVGRICLRVKRGEGQKMILIDRPKQASLNGTFRR